MQLIKTLEKTDENHGQILDQACLNRPIPHSIEAWIRMNSIVLIMNWRLGLN